MKPTWLLVLTLYSATLAGNPQQPPQTASSDACSLTGEWREGAPNEFRWDFHARGNILNIRRTDDFVAGTFTPAKDGWIGQLHWANGDTYDNVLLSPDPNCMEIRTNQVWWFKK